MAQQRERGAAAAAEFPRQRGREKRGSEPGRKQLRIGGFKGIQSGHSWAPSLRSTAISARVVPQDCHAGRPASQDRRAASAVAARGGKVLCTRE